MLLERFKMTYYTSSIIRDPSTGRILISATANLMVRRGEAKDYKDACSKISKRKKQQKTIDMDKQWLPYRDD